LKLSFTTVLLHNADVVLLIAVACSVAKKESTKIQVCYSVGRTGLSTWSTKMALFLIDLLKLSFTTVLLHNADVELLIAVACSVAKKESTKIQVCYSY